MWCLPHTNLRELLGAYGYALEGMMLEILMTCVVYTYCSLVHLKSHIASDS